jgi:predicted naringenin-chalcone synthase
MPAVIKGIGTAIPDNVRPTEYWVEQVKLITRPSAKQERVLGELYRRTEIKQRASVLTIPGEDLTDFFPQPTDAEDTGPGTAERMQRYCQDSVPLAVTSAKQALAASGTEATDITHLVTVSCTGFYAPGLDINLINSLNMRSTTLRTNIGFMGCHGSMNGLRVASALVTADHSATVLLCATELCSLHFQYGWETDNLVANSLFADGSASLVIRYDEAAPSANKELNSAGSANQFILVDSTSMLLADTTDVMHWSIGNHGFRMHLSARVPSIVSKHLPPFLSGWLAQHGLRIADIAGWSVHPGGPKILDAVAQCLELPDECIADSQAILNECGNMSSPTVLFILQRLAARNVKGPCVMLGFGPGLTIEAALLTR